MSRLEIDPGRAIGPLRLGMTEAEALGAMASAGVEGERQRLWDMTADPPAQYDADPVVLWFADCLRADFDGEGRLEFLELADGALRGMVGDTDLLATDQRNAVALLAAATGEDPVVEDDGSSIVFPGAAAALWRGGDDERAPGRWESVSVAAPGYYD